MDSGKVGPMNFKILGAMLIILSGGGFGFIMAASYKKEVKILRELDQIIKYMISELQYRQLPLPELCKNASAQAEGPIGKFFINFAEEMEAQILPDVQQCIQAALTKSPLLPRIVCELLDVLGANLGKFDLDGQISGLEWVELECKRTLEKMTVNQELKRRNYQTLGLCVGAALAILIT